MIKVEITKGCISFKGHAGYKEYGSDIVCAAVSSVLICTTEAIARFDKDAIDVQKDNQDIKIIINKFDNITNNLIINMITCLKEISKKYSKNVQIISKEE